MKNSLKPKWNSLEVHTNHEVPCMKPGMRTLECRGQKLHMLPICLINWQFRHWQSISWRGMKLISDLEYPRHCRSVNPGKCYSPRQRSESNITRAWHGRMGWAQGWQCVTRKSKTGVQRDCNRRGRGFGETQHSLQDPARPAANGKTVSGFMGVAWVWRDQLRPQLSDHFRSVLYLWLPDHQEFSKLEA